MLPWISGAVGPADTAPVRLRWAQLGSPCYVALLAPPRELARHRFAGVGVLCAGATCALCLSGQPRDNRFYAPAVLVAREQWSGNSAEGFQRCVWELTPDQQAGWPSTHHRPLIMLAERIHRPNGMVRLTKWGAWRWEPVPTAFPIDPVLTKVYARNVAGLERQEGGGR